jgi:hypothetical protein
MTTTPSKPPAGPSPATSPAPSPGLRRATVATPPLPPSIGNEAHRLLSAPLPFVVYEVALESLRVRCDELFASEADQAGIEAHEEKGTARLANLADKAARRVHRSQRGHQGGARFAPPGTAAQRRHGGSSRPASRGDPAPRRRRDVRRIQRSSVARWHDQQHRPAAPRPARRLPPPRASSADRPARLPSARDDQTAIVLTAISARRVKGRPSNGPVSGHTAS